MQKVRYRIRKLSGAVALLSAELILVLLVFFISLALLIILIRQIFYHKQDAFDDRVFVFLSHYVNHTNTVLMQGVTFLGSHFFLIPAWLLLFAFYIVIKKDKWNFIKAAIIAVSNLLLMFGLKFLFNRPRPLIPLLKEVPGLSFPSGHAFMSLTFFGLIMYSIYHSAASKWLKWTAIAVLGMVIFMIGLSRVYLRLHYASDVIAGYCFGMVSLILIFWLLRQVEKYNAKKIPYHLNVTKTGKDSSLTKVN